MKRRKTDAIYPKIINYSGNITSFFKINYYPHNCNLSTASKILGINKKSLWAWMKRNSIETKNQSVSQTGTLNPFNNCQHTKKSKIKIGIASKDRQYKMARGKHGRYGNDGKHPFGIKNPTWKTGNSNPFYKRIIKKRGNQCEKCKTKYKLHVHHRSKDRTDNDDTNLKVLCASCHHKKHPKERDEKGRFV